jgi:hypothetical protein
LRDDGFGVLREHGADAKGRLAGKHGISEATLYD